MSSLLNLRYTYIKTKQNITHKYHKRYYIVRTHSPLALAVAEFMMGLCHYTGKSALYDFSPLWHAALFSVVFSDNYFMSWRLDRFKMMKHFILLVAQSSKWANIMRGTVYHFQTTPSQHGFTWLTLHFLCWALHMKRSSHRMIPRYVDAVVLIGLDSRRVSQGVPGQQELKWRTQMVCSD